MDTESLIRWFFADYLFANKKNAVLNPSVVCDLQGYGQELIRDLFPKSASVRIDEKIMASALDLLVYRLYLASPERIKNAALRELLERAPNSSVTLKLLVLNTLTAKAPGGF